MKLAWRAGGSGAASPQRLREDVLRLLDLALHALELL